MSVPSYSALTAELTGRWLVEASAGTGKTWTLSWLFARMVVESDHGVEQILVITYTNAAAAELRERLRKRLVECLDAIDAGAPAPMGEDDDDDGAFFWPEVDGAPAWEEPPAWQEPWDEDGPPLVEHAGAAFDDGPPPDEVSQVPKRFDEATLQMVDAWRSSPGLTEARSRLAKAIGSFDAAAISTIHAFCLRALRDHAFDAGDGFALDLSAAASELVDQVTHDVWTACLYDRDPRFVQRMTEGYGHARAVVGAAVGAVRAQLVPEPSAGVDVEAALSAFDAEVEAFAAAWADGGRVEALGIGGHPNLNGNKVRRSTVIQNAARIDKWLELAPRPAPDKKVSEALYRLTGEYLRAARKGQLKVPTFAISAAAEALVAARALMDADFDRARVAVLWEMAEMAERALDRLRPTATTVFFDDLLRRLHDALLGDGGTTLALALRAAFPAALVDEFQDTDPVQDAILHRLYPPGEGGTLVLVGDPKQAIYAFRGADLHTYLGAAHRPGVQRRSLDTNRRSDENLVAATTWLFEQVERPFGGVDIEYVRVHAHHKNRVTGAGAPLQLLVVPAESQLSDEAVVAADVLRMLRAGVQIEDRPLQPGDLAVLTSSHRLAQGVVIELAKRGVPVVRRGHQSVLHTAEAKLLALLLDAALAPGRTDRVKAVLASDLGGWDAAEIAGLDGDEGRVQRWLGAVEAWRLRWGTRGFMSFFRAAMAELGVMARMLAADGGERSLTNLRHVAELLHTAEREARLGPQELRRWLRDAMEETTIAEEHEIRLESDGRAVQVLTMHTSKGLQYPFVWVLGLCSRRKVDDPPLFHDEDGQRTLDLAQGDASHEAAQEEADQERLRLAYVALTRAEHVCVPVIDVPSRGGLVGPLPALLGLPFDKEAPDTDDVLAALTQQIEPVPHLVELRVPEPVDGGYRRLGLDEELRAPVAPQRRVLPDLRITSFSGLVAAAGEDDGADRDAHALHRPDDLTLPSPLPLALFPRGPDAGTAVHEVLELLDFAAPETGAELIQAVLTKASIDPELWAETLAVGLAAALRTPIEPDGFCLAELPRADRADELDFVLPAGTAAQPLDGAGLARDLEALDDPIAQAYAPRLRRIGGNLVDAALKGFIDLVYRRGGRWYVVDYKTNHLGRQPDDYDAAALQNAMIDGDYVLQASLYALAVHRFLRTRVRGYDYDRDFGGVRYLFLRGMRPETGHERGVFAFKPSRAWIDAWDARFRGGAP